MPDVIQQVRDLWPLIMQEPWGFLLLGFTLLGAGWWFRWLFDKREIRVYEQRIKFAGDRLQEAVAKADGQMKTDLLAVQDVVRGNVELLFPDECNEDSKQSKFKRSHSVLVGEKRASFHRFCVGVKNGSLNKTNGLST